ncbi:ion transporter [Alteromonas mediterranea]|jgi:voltage-gated sodium channel|uniref:Kef-type K+ transport system NAD-binding protein n=3 Tax=Alteromonas mediterranea TaxID=314275 RepID=S5ADS3_9ALTE|nr:MULTISPECIES: ion transporter [Alteromonas]AGP76931.1 Kef-type K+ transport system NAD-binding protein [Alteromonas mediterranea 615]AGP92413.1 Kef-type K+ transport system NAD-binding protein [Alteromonas mediterranea U8]MDY6882495.1 ion transporter [Pseudomonadota bacterium]AEA96855.1 ion transporter [Alteromonas mediterranea DE]AFV84161.1 Kef-type K+ transport system NAD-binding protein [Alteromonas mediterranea DE1]|tara:strand:- start:359 stop:1213 length:855 start_codon:yes stop_codon:yes gene_type:complete
MQASELQNKFERIRANKWFEAFVISVIVISALLVGAKTYELPSGMASVTLFLDWFISAFFLTELTIRFLAEKQKRFFFRSFWNWFDTLIVVISLIPADDTELALIARLVRVFRVLRMISIIPELRILLVSLVKALPQLAYVMLLMFIIFYIYAAVGSTLFENINPVLWGDITISMLTLFRIMTFEDWTDVMYETQEVYSLSWIFYLTFIFFTAFAFLNMVIGIVVNVMERENEKARAEKEAALLEEQMAQGHVEPTLHDVMKELRELKAQVSAQAVKGETNTSD